METESHKRKRDDAEIDSVSEESSKRFKKDEDGIAERMEIISDTSSSAAVHAAAAATPTGIAETIVKDEVVSGTASVEDVNIAVDPAAATAATIIKTEDDADEEAKANKRLPKKKYAVMFGYLGTGYRGLQIQPGAPTIELELGRAIFAAGGFLPSNWTADGSRLQVNDWTRAARTDKGVHAMGQTVSVKIQMPKNGEEEFRKKLNHYLPRQIQVFSIRQATAQFSAFKDIDRRRYEYLLPSFVLQPLPAGVKVQAVDEVIISDKPADLHETFVPDSTVTESGLGLLDLEHRKAFRVTPEMMKSLNEILGKFVGTKDFHNYTKGVRSGEARGQRYILSFKAESPTVVDGGEWIRLRVTGQSFMLHQIRKMIGMAIEVFRGSASRATFAKSMTKANVVVPMAPATGLYLDMCIYEKYNKKFKKTHKPIDFESPDVAEQREAFKIKFLFPHIVEEEKKKLPFANYLVSLESYRKLFSFEFSDVDDSTIARNLELYNEAKDANIRKHKLKIKQMRKDHIEHHERVTGKRTDGEPGADGIKAEGAGGSKDGEYKLEAEMDEDMSEAVKAEEGEEGGDGEGEEGIGGGVKEGLMF